MLDRNLYKASVLLDLRLERHRPTHQLSPSEAFLYSINVFDADTYCIHSSKITKTLGQRHVLQCGPL
jgi:hypothetical protein